MEEAARLLAVSRWTVFRLVKQRRLVSVVVATRCRRIPASSVEAYIAERIEEAA
ncbi:helix-turn-helix transcriptional regulator [Phytohabitans kaempferiae]|uniref:Helix-turn-helix transcriptional regulator n=1 Tax=Phytohabitans kaempferiae TaxID=1620943 RepID=A0ABV6MER5_9ACTN